MMAEEMTLIEELVNVLERMRQVSNDAREIRPFSTHLIEIECIADEALTRYQSEKGEGVWVDRDRLEEAIKCLYLLEYAAESEGQLTVKGKSIKEWKAYLQRKGGE